MATTNGADMGALDGRNGVGDGRPVHEWQFLRERRAEMYPHRASVRSGQPGGPAGDVVGRHDARQQHDLSPGPVQAGVLRQERRRQLRRRVRRVDRVGAGPVVESP